MRDELYKDVDVTKGESIRDNRVDRDEVNQTLGFEANPDLEEDMNEYKLPETSTSFGTSFDYMQHQANRQLFNLENGIERNIGRPGFGDSYYDQYASDLWDVENLNELRANEQGLISKIAGGVGRFATITTMGTVGNIVGTVTGLIEGTADAISADDHKWDAFWQGFWNNKVNQFVHSVIDTANEYMPAYESEYEKNLGVFESLLTGNFWANQIANMGWTSAAIISTVLTGGMGAASGASAIARTLGASKNAANWIYRLVGGFTGSMSEAATEAIENYNESRTAYANSINNDYQTKRAALDAKIIQEFEARKAELGYGVQRYDNDGRPIPIVNNPEFEQRLMQAIQEEHAAEYQALEQEVQEKYMTVDQHAKDAGTNTFGMNVLILGLSNTLGVFSGITTPMNNVNRMAKGSIKNLWKGAGEKIAASKAELITLEALSPFVEGNEEMLQKVASESAKSYYGQYYNPEFTGQLRSYVDVAGETFKDVYSDKQAWKEFAAGFFTGLLGAGGIGHKTVKTDDGKRHTIRPEWTGGLIKGLVSGEISEEAERSASIYKEANDLYNKYNTDKNLQARARLIIGTMADKDAMAKAIENGDKKSFLDHEAEMLIRAIETFTDIGRMNDFKTLVGKDINMTDDEIREFAAVNSEEIKDADGKGTGRYKSNLPVVDANGELLSETAEGREQIRERLKKDSEKINRLINAYSEALEDTDAESNYSLNRDQLKMLTWAKMKGMDSEDRQNSLGEEINKNVLWKALYDAYLSNRTYRNDDDEEAYKALEAEAEKLKEIIDEYNKNTSLTEAQQKNKKIFESDYKNIKQAIDAVNKRRKATKDEGTETSKEEVETGKKDAVEQLFEMLDENVKGTLLASILAAKVGHKGDKDKTPIYFANIIANLLEESMGSEAASIIKDLNDILKLNADRIAYDKMYREFMEAPEKITDMFDGILKESQDANFKRLAKQSLQDYNENKDYFDSLTDYLNSGFLATEPDEIKEKLRGYLIENSTDAYYKDLKEKFKNRINEALDGMDAEKTDKLVKDIGYTKEFINNSNLITNQQSLLYSTKEDIIEEAINMGYSDTDATQIAYNLTKIADEYRKMASTLADIKEKIDKAAEEKKAKGETPKSDNTVEIAPTNITDSLPQNISEYLANHLLADGSKYDEKIMSMIKAYVDYAGLENFNNVLPKINQVVKGKIQDQSSDSLMRAYNALIALTVGNGGKDLSTLISYIDKLIEHINKNALNVSLLQSIRVQPFSLLPVQDNYDGLFVNSPVKPEIEVIEDKDFVSDKAFVGGIEITEMPELRPNGEVDKDGKALKLLFKGAFKVTIIKPAKAAPKEEKDGDAKSKETEDKLRLQKAEETAIQKLADKPMFNTTNVNTDRVDIEEHEKVRKDDPQRKNKTLRIYLKDQHQKGYFELVKDEEDGYYSVHFKTASDNTNSNEYNADQTELSNKEERQILFEELANALPDGALLSTHGEISPAGERALVKLAKLANAAKVGERVIKSKKTGEDVTIGIYQKDKPNVEKTTKPEEEQPPVVTPEDTESTPQSRTKKALDDYVDEISNKVFFIDKGHTYYIYIGEDQTKGREEFERFQKDIEKGEATKNDYSKYGFTINTRSASTLRYGMTESSSSDDAKLSQKIGNDIDTIIRMVFQGFSPEEIKKELEYLVSEEDGIDNTTEIFGKIDAIKEAIWEAMKDYGGKDCTIITNPINLIARIKEESGDEILAGTPDMLVIDKNGVIHIFDMKAKKIDNLISKENPNAYRNENDYERYQTQLFAYAQMLKAAGFNVDTNTAHLIQFKTKDTVTPTFLGISELTNEGEGKAITDNIHAFDNEGLKPKTNATSISDIGEAIKNEQPAPTTPKEEKKNKEDEKVLDANDEAQQTFEQKIKETLGDAEGLTQWGYVIPNYNDFTKSEARGVYNRSNDFRVKYLRDNGAYDFLDRGKVKANALIYLKDVTPELMKEYPNYDYSYYHYIGVYVKDETTGKLQIVGILDSDSISRGGISEKDRAEGNIRGNTSHSINNNIMVALEVAKAFHTTNRGAKYRRMGLTDTGYVFNNSNEKVPINLQATAIPSEKFTGYFTIENADKQKLRVAKVAPGRIQTRKNKEDESRDLVPVTSVKVNGEDFKEAFKNKRAFVGVLIGQDLRPTILDADGEVRNDISSDLKVPNVPSGSMIVVFKGADNEWKCSVIIGNDFNSTDNKDNNNKVAKNIDYHLLHVADDGQYYGLAEDLYISAVEDDGLLDTEEIQNVKSDIEKGFDNVFNFLNRKPNSVEYDYSSKVVTLTFTIGTAVKEITIDTYGKSRDAIKNELYGLLSSLSERYSLAQEIFLSDEASSEAKIQRLNSIIENSSTNIDEFTTRNTKVVLSYYDAASFVLPTGSARESYTSRNNYNEISFTLNGGEYVLRKNAKGASRRYQLRKIDSNHWVEDNQTVANTFGYKYEDISATKVLSSTMDVFLGKLYELLTKYDFKLIHLAHTNELNNGILHISETTKDNGNLINPELYYDIRANKFLSKNEGKEGFSAPKEQPVKKQIEEKQPSKVNSITQPSNDTKNTENPLVKKSDILHLLDLHNKFIGEYNSTDKELSFDDVIDKLKKDGKFVPFWGFLYKGKFYKNYEDFLANNDVDSLVKDGILEKDEQSGEYYYANDEAKDKDKIYVSFEPDLAEGWEYDYFIMPSKNKNKNLNDEEYYKIVKEVYKDLYKELEEAKKHNEKINKKKEQLTENVTNVNTRLINSLRVYKQNGGSLREDFKDVEDEKFQDLIYDIEIEKERQEEFAKTMEYGKSIYEYLVKNDTIYQKLFGIDSYSHINSQGVEEQTVSWKLYDTLSDIVAREVSGADISYAINSFITNGYGTVSSLYSFFVDIAHEMYPELDYSDIKLTDKRYDELQNAFRKKVDFIKSLYEKLYNYFKDNGFEYNKINAKSQNSPSTEGVQLEQPKPPMPEPPAKPEEKNKFRQKGRRKKSVSEKVVKLNKNKLFTRNEGEYNAHSLLDSIDSNIARLLKSVISRNTTITVLTDEEFNAKYGTETNGIYERGKVILKLSSSDNTLIHELCHLTVPSILQNETAAAKLTEIFDKYKKYLQMNPELGETYSSDGVSTRYAASTLYEFISELFSNSKVADILKSIPEDYFVKDDLSNKYVVNSKYRNELDNTVNTNKKASEAKKDNLFKRIIRHIVAFFTQKASKSSIQPVKNLYTLAYEAGTELIKSFDVNADVTNMSDISTNDNVYSTLYSISNKTEGLFDVRGKNSITINDFIQEAKAALKEEDEQAFANIDKLVNAFDLNNLSKEAETSSKNISWNKIGLVLMQLAVLENIVDHSNFGEVAIFEKVSFANYNSKYNKNTQGLTNLFSNNVYINDGLNKFQKIQIALHEIIHTVTSLELKNNEQFRQEVSKMFNKAKEYVANTPYIVEYGFTNEREFMSEALSNPRFMGILASIKLDDYEQNGLSDVTMLIKKMLRNLSTKKAASTTTYTALDKIAQIIKKYGRIYSRQDLLSKYYYERVNRKSLRDYEAKIDNIVDFESEHSIFTRMALKKLNKAGIIKDILPLAQPFNSENINRESLKSLFVAILPVIKSKDFTSKEIDDIVESYYDFAFGYTEDTKSSELYTLVETLGNHSNKLSLTIGANTQINKINFAVTDKNDNFASPLKQQIESCSI